jgi:hypothetical protein
MPTLSDDAGRFWTAVFGGITAIGLIAGGFYTLVQYESSKSNNEETLKVQLANSKFEAEKPFFQRQLDLCAEASSSAAILSTTAGRGKAEVQKAKGDFWRLYWGPLGMVEDEAVESAMVRYGRCLQTRCDNTRIEILALDLAHACRKLVANSWDVHLEALPTDDTSKRNSRQFSR